MLTLSPGGGVTVEGCVIVCGSERSGMVFVDGQAQTILSGLGVTDVETTTLATVLELWILCRRKRALGTFAAYQDSPFLRRRARRVLRVMAWVELHLFKPRPR